MQRSSASLMFALLIAGPMVFVPRGVAAQSNPQQLADANRASMDAYNNLDIELAKTTLEAAAKKAAKAGVKGPALARTYANLGVVYVGGLSDNAAGLDAFVTALGHDPTVEPDPLVSTPEIQQVYELAKRKAGVSGGSAESAPAAPPRAPGPVGGNLKHVPPAEQLSQTGVPVYAEGPELGVASMEIFYRSLGMARPNRAALTAMGDGFGFLIPCTDVFEPNVEYFIVAKDAEGKQVGNAGTPQAPIVVPIVRQRSLPPAALPGQPPPSQCGGGEECPPGMPGCGGHAGMGGTCHSDADCGDGLVCSDDFCAVGDRADRGHGSAGPPRWFANVGFGIGGAYVGRGAKADTAVPRRLLMTATSEETAQAAARKAGWECPVRTVTDDTTGQSVPQLYNCSVAVAKPGLVPSLAVHAVVGGHITPRFYLAAMGRVQLDHGTGALAGMLFGGRGGVLITKPAETGFMASVFAGGSAGQIQVQPPAQPGGQKGPWVVSGLAGAQLGSSLSYRLVRNFGFNLTPQVHLLVPTLLLNVDVAAGVEAAF